ncbi:hypothetical protein IMSAG185_02001 [Lachnospiraceae bacterium]|jgi:hypothetical protein|nr:hypothetical protein IMSAG185_02001 [Lachnospiraceae bacterium]
MTIRRVEKANPAYQMIQGEVVYWFDRDTFDPTGFSIEDTLTHIIAAAVKSLSNLYAWEQFRRKQSIERKISQLSGNCGNQPIEGYGRLY